jgi:hypothetical protein
MVGFGDLEDRIERERVLIEELTKTSGASHASHLGLVEKSAIPLLRSDEEAGGSDSEAGGLVGLGDSTPLETSVVILPAPPKQVVMAPAMPPRPGPKTQAQMASLFALLQNPTRGKGPSAPPPISQLVADRYEPVMDQVQDAFDRMEAWALAVKNWKLWTLFMDQYGLANEFPRPQPEMPPPIPNMRSELHRLLTKNVVRFRPCPILKCKQSLFHEEHVKVIRPWLKTNFSSALMNLGDTFGILLLNIPRGVSESSPPDEIVQFLTLPNAAELVYKGIGPIFNLDISQQMSDKIRTDAMAAKRKFIDEDLLALKHRTNIYLQTLNNLQQKCTSKTLQQGPLMDRIFDLQRAMDWHAASHHTYDSLNNAFRSVNW